MKAKQVTCRCDAESYPHRLESTLACRELYNHSDISDDFKAGLLRDFERTEAQAMNSERSIFNNMRF